MQTYVESFDTVQNDVDMVGINDANEIESRKEAEDGVRTINFHVAHPEAAIVHAQSIQENSELPVTLDLAFDPTWNSYRTWVG